MIELLGQFFFFTLMMLLRRGAAFTDSRRMVSVSWPPTGRMTPLRRPRDALGGTKSGAPSLQSPSPHPSRSDMSTRRRKAQFKTNGGEELIKSLVLTPIKFAFVERGCHLLLLSSSCVRLEETGLPKFPHKLIITEL